MTEIYLDPMTCNQVGLGYWDGHDENVTETAEPKAVWVGDLLSKRRLWDYKHRSLFAAYVRSGDLMWIRPSPGPGWFEVITDTPKDFMTDAKTFEQVLKAD